MTLRGWTWLAWMAAFAAGCGAASQPRAAQPKKAEENAEAAQTKTAEKPAEAVKEQPPESGERHEIQFPEIARSKTKSGLELNTVEMHQLPLVELKLVIRSGSAADPEDLPGMAHLVTQMLKEGTRKRSSAQLAEDVEFLGADLSVSSDAENIYITMRALSDHLEQALGIVADVAMNPRFSPKELRKLKRRELDRLQLQQNEPRFLAAREFFETLYGEHPYAHIDTTPKVVERIQRGQLVRWHRQHFAPNNAFLVVVGDVQPEEVEGKAQKVFARWRPRDVPDIEYPEPPERKERRIIVVDRPESVQSVLYLGNLALSRSDEDYVPLLVANQVLGGSAASRLFMDLRERRSLTYGAYSSVFERVDVAPFRAYAAVRNEVTGEAMSAFMHHLDAIVKEAPSQPEMVHARSYLSDSFPLKIETAAKIADLIADQRIYDLPDDYWERFREEIRDVEAEEALQVAQEHIQPERMLVVVVGKAAEIADTLEKYGPVTVVDPSGEVIRDSDAQTEDAKKSKEAKGPETGSKPASDKASAKAGDGA